MKRLPGPKQGAYHGVRNRRRWPSGHPPWSGCHDNTASSEARLPRCIRFLRSRRDPSMNAPRPMQFRTRFCLLGFTPFLWSACATSGGAPDVIQPRAGITAAEYYPLSDGWKWAYDVEQEGTNILATYAVVEVREKLSVVQAGDDRLTYLVAADGVAQFDGNAIGDYVIKDPIRPGAEWPVTGGRARIASANEELNVDSVGRYAGCVVVEVTRA